MKLVVDNIRDLKLKQYFLWAGTLGLIVVLIWIGLGIQAASTKSTVEKKMEETIKPINPTIDTEVFTLLKDRFIPPEEFTILVIQESDGTTRVVPLRSNERTAPLSSASGTTPLASRSGVVRD